MNTLNTIISILSGALFACSWWIVIHADAWAKIFHPGTDYSWWFYIAPLITSLGVLLINLVSAQSIENDNDGLWGSGSSGNRGILFSFFAILIGGVGMAVWIGAQWYFSKDGLATTWPGQALLLGSVGLSASGMLFKFGRRRNEDDFGF